MIHLRKNIKTESKAILYFLLFIFIFKTNSLAFDLTDQKSVSVSATISDNRVTIFGFTSPQIRVELTSPKVYAISYSDQTGYFVFDKTILPKNPNELCISSIDDNGRRSSPVCLPSPPSTNYHTNIGPVILPPTISIDTDQVAASSTTTASGQSIPDSTIAIYLYQISNQANYFAPAVEAFELPVFNTLTDDNGNYSFSLPTAYASDYRLYSTVKYNDQPSPKSNTLRYNLPQAQNSYLIIIFFLTLPIFILLIYLSKRPSKSYYPVPFYYPLVKIN